MNGMLLDYFLLYPYLLMLLTSLYLASSPKSLFNLLEFQRLVLNYSPPARVHDLPRNQKVRSQSAAANENKQKNRSAATCETRVIAASCSSLAQLAAV